MTQQENHRKPLLFRYPSVSFGSDWRSNQSDVVLASPKAAQRLPVRSDPVTVQLSCLIPSRFLGLDEIPMALDLNFLQPAFAAFFTGGIATLAAWNMGHAAEMNILR